MSPSTETRSSWLSKEELETHRARMPIVYVEAVPVRVDSNGTVTRIGTLLLALRKVPCGAMSCDG